MNGDTEWSVPPPEEQVLWRGERVPVSAFLIPLVTLGLVLLVVTVEVLQQPSVAGFVALAKSVSAFLLLGLFVASHGRTIFIVTNLRARVMGGLLARGVREMPVTDLISIAVLPRRSFPRLDLQDVVLRSDHELLRFRAVRNAEELVVELARLHRDRAQVLARVEMEEGALLFVFVSATAESLEPLDAPSPAATSEDRPRRLASLRLFAPAILLVTTGLAFFASASFRSDPIEYPEEDAIVPGGVKRTDAEIVSFMEREVMPFARQALGPVVGGAGKVTCETCHGEDAEARDWAMPAVRALPEPAVLLGADHGTERDGFVNTAIYGYLAAGEHQVTMRRMRDVVLPGMAQLLHRPAWDFTRTYEYNRRHFAFGCYHCHRIEE